MGKRRGLKIEIEVNERAYMVTFMIIYVTYICIYFAYIYAKKKPCYEWRFDNN
jgi:hypothetical protein